MTTTPKALPALPDGIRSTQSPIWRAILNWESAPEGEEAGKAASVIDEVIEQMLNAYAQQAIADSLASAGGVAQGDDELIRAIGDGLLCAHDHLEMHKLERSHCNSAASIREGLAAFSAYKKRPDFNIALTKEREVADGLRAELEAVKRDAVRIDWIQRQGLDDFAMGLVIDAPHDGEYWVSPDSGGMYYGKSIREAIDAAIEAAKENGNGDR